MIQHFPLLEETLRVRGFAPGVFSAASLKITPVCFQTAVYADTTSDLR